MDKDGTLHWDVPAGNWTILRMGYSLTGAMNRPCDRLRAAGYEVDKLSAKYVQQYFHGYMDPIQQNLGDLTGSTLQYMTMDSWEAGMQNWTDDMIAEFQRRRGYDPTPYLPVLAGRVVESADVSDRFLWDFRRTLADMFAGDFYGTMDSELQQAGHGQLFRGLRRGAGDSRRHAAEQEPYRYSDGGVLGACAASGVDVLRGCARRGLGGACVRQADCGDRVVYRRRIRVALHAEEDCRLLVYAGREPAGVSHLGASSRSTPSPATRWWARTSIATSPGRSRPSR